MRFILNIGLNVGATTAISAEVARQILAANDLLPVNDGVVHASDTEPTLVIEVEAILCSPMFVIQALRATADDLQQDCIAVYRPKTGAGTLIGQKAAEWGPFNPEFFILPDGSRLSGPAAQAA
jgi:hypothetical protein